MVHLAIFSDLHVHPHQEFSQLVEGVNSRLIDCASVVDEVVSWSTKRKVDAIVFCGDLFHKRGEIKPSVLDRVVKPLARAKKLGISVFMDDGNHDHEDKAGSVHPLTSLHRADLIKTIMPPGKGWAIWRVGDLSVCAFSYCDSVDELERRLDACAKVVGGGQKVAVMHHGFQGARVGTHLEYEVREPISAKALLEGRGFSTIFSGHYHARQRIRGMENAWYVGSPLELARSSRVEGKKKGFLSYMSDTNSFKLVPVVRPRFLKISGEGLDALDAQDDRLVELQGNFVDVEWSGDFPGGRERLEANLRDAGARAWKLVLARPPASAPSRAVVDPRTPPWQALAAWLETKGDEMEGLGLDSASVAAAGLKLLAKASEEEEGA